jgi:TolB-like protein/tetratricopeptide (TPR) repeat protein
VTAFIARLKQRKLVQWALAYIAFAFALIQVLDVVAGSYDWPHGVMHIVFGLVALGFVVALVLAWYHGEQGRQRISGPELLLIALVLAIGGGLLWRFGRPPTSTGRPEVAQRNPGTALVNSPASSAVVAASGIRDRAHPIPIPAKSIAVLPFTNLSGDAKQQYFSDGITEELTDALGQNPALRVIAWETASNYRDPKLSANEIGQRLHVADILHGSIAREGDEVRVTAELVNASTGYQLWSAHYDKPFKNIFAMQDAVTRAIAGALQVKFAQADLPPGGTINPEAHDLVLKGRALADKEDAAGLKGARQDFEQAIKLDPNYADAHALLSRMLLTLIERSSLPLAQVMSETRSEAKRALALDPRNSDAWEALGDADASADPPDFAKAREEFREALALDPSNAYAHLDYGNVLPLEQSLAEEREAARLDPDYATAWANLAEYSQDAGDWVGEAKASETLIGIDPADVDGAFYLAYARRQLRQDDAAVRAFDTASPASTIDREQVKAGKLVYQSLQNLRLRPQAMVVVRELAVHSSSQDVAGNLLYLYAALGERADALKLLQRYCLSNPFGCFDIAINPLYVPLHDDPVFQKLARKYSAITRDGQPAMTKGGTARG